MRLPVVGTLDHVTPIDAIFWKLIPGLNPLEHEPRFFKEEGGKFTAVSSATKLSTMSGSDGAATVYLAVKDKGAFKVRI